MNPNALTGPQPLKDPDAEHPIPGAWRPMLREVVHCFAQGDYRLKQGIRGVEPVSVATVEHIREYLADYGATLVELPDETWQTSVSQWIDPHWEILVDLWTAEEGRSDLVLLADVVETSTGPRFTLDKVYVP